MKIYLGLGIGKVVDDLSAGAEVWVVSQDLNDEGAVDRVFRDDGGVSGTGELWRRVVDVSQLDRHLERRKKRVLNKFCFLKLLMKMMTKQFICNPDGA